MHEDRERCVRAVQSKDARFDGWFFTAVTSTGVYCRPSCPVVPPKAENMRFYPSAAAAQQAGFRACKRCRPDASPGSPQWNERADLVARASHYDFDVDGRYGVVVAHSGGLIAHSDSPARLADMARDAAGLCDGGGLQTLTVTEAR